MKTQVTQKKTLKIKKKSKDEESDAVLSGSEPMLRQAPMPIDSPSYKLPVIIALVAAVMFLALVALQALELSFYSQPPSAWALSAQQAVSLSYTPEPEMESEADLESEDAVDLESDSDLE